MVDGSVQWQFGRGMSLRKQNSSQSRTSNNCCAQQPNTPSPQHPDNPTTQQPNNPTTNRRCTANLPTCQPTYQPTFEQSPQQTSIKPTKPTNMYPANDNVLRGGDDPQRAAWWRRSASQELAVAQLAPKNRERQCKLPKESRRKC